MKFYISDLHMYHDNIIRFEHRPFKDMDEMILTIIERWNEVVTEEDEVYLLGDVFYRQKDPGACLEILQTLHGTKYCIRGNHDRFLHNKMLQEQFAWVRDTDCINDTNRMVILNHYPMESWNGKSRGSFMLYGHIHSKWGGIARALKNRYNVSCEVLNYRPHTLDQLIEEDLDFKNKGTPRDVK